jgi:hypothetical protein
MMQAFDFFKFLLIDIFAGKSARQGLKPAHHLKKLTYFLWIKPTNARAPVWQQIYQALR